MADSNSGLQASAQRILPGDRRGSPRERRDDADHGLPGVMKESEGLSPSFRTHHSGETA